MVVLPTPSSSRANGVSFLHFLIRFQPTDSAEEPKCGTESEETTHQDALQTTIVGSDGLEVVRFSGPPAHLQKVGLRPSFQSHAFQAWHVQRTLRSRDTAPLVPTRTARDSPFTRPQHLTPTRMASRPASLNAPPLGARLQLGASPPAPLVVQSPRSALPQTQRSGPRKSSSRWGPPQVFRACDKQPRRAWRLLGRLADLATTPELVSDLGAGPLEDFIRSHAPSSSRRLNAEPETMLAFVEPFAAFGFLARATRCPLGSLRWASRRLMSGPRRNGRPDNKWMQLTSGAVRERTPLAADPCVLRIPPDRSSTAR